MSTVPSSSIFLLSTVRKFFPSLVLNNEPSCTVVPACPVIVKITLEFVASCRIIPCSSAFLVSQSPQLVCGNDASIINAISAYAFSNSLELADSVSHAKPPSIIFTLSPAISV